MAIHKIHLEEFSSMDYEIVAIHSQAEAHKLAFILNKCLNLRFKIEPFISIHKNQAEGLLAHYKFEDEKNEIYWDLIENKAIISNTNINNSLFDDVDSVIYLIPEFKNVDFFLKIEVDDVDDFIKDLIPNLIENKIISTAYKMDKQKVKSKNNLIL